MRYVKQGGQYVKDSIGQYKRTLETCPEVDVVLPYSRPYLRFLPLCFETIAGQIDVEPVIHLVSDGVPEDHDPGPELEKVYPRTFRYRNEDGPVGPYISFNRVIRGGHTRSDYLAVADADDFYFPHRLRWSVMEILDGADLTGGSMVSFVDPPGRSDPGLLSARHQKDIRYSGEFENRPNHRIRVMNATMTLTSSAFQRLNGFENWPHSADMELVNRTYAAGFKIRTTREFLAAYRVHGESLAQSTYTGIWTEERKRGMEEVKRRFDRLRQGKLDPLAYGGLEESRPDLLTPLSEGPL